MKKVEGERSKGNVGLRLSLRETEEVSSTDLSEPASLSPVLVDQVLRSQLGYQGVVITDAMDAKGLQQFMQQKGYTDPMQRIAEASVRAILAGNDLVECSIEPNRLAAVVTAVTTAVKSGRITQDRLRQSLRHIIALKERLGLVSMP
jgi:beta-N-acetylhexosaminidase